MDAEYLRGRPLGWPMMTIDSSCSTLLDVRTVAGVTVVDGKSVGA